MIEGFDHTNPHQVVQDCYDAARKEHEQGTPDFFNLYTHFLKHAYHDVVKKWAEVTGVRTKQGE